MITTERQVANAIGLVIAGATGISDTDIYRAVAHELADWLDNSPEVAAELVSEYFAKFMRPSDLRDELALHGEDAIATQA